MNNVDLTFILLFFISHVSQLLLGLGPILNVHERKFTSETSDGVLCCD